MFDIFRNQDGSFRFMAHIVCNIKEPELTVQHFVCKKDQPPVFAYHTFRSNT